MLKKTEIRLAVLGLALIGTASAWYLISPLFTTTMIRSVFPTLGFLPSRTPQPPTEMPLPTKTPLPTRDLGQSLLVDIGSAQLLLRGEFYSLGHSGQGLASIYLVGSSLVLRVESFTVERGADLRVALTPYEQIQTSLGIDLVELVDLGPLKAEEGNQNYAIPAGVDPLQVHSVVIWSSGSGELFMAASLEPPQ